MDKRIIQKQILINAAPEIVWKVFTEPAITENMGGEYVSDWKIGSAIGWKDHEGNMRTKGTILSIEPGIFLQHNLLNDDDTVSSVITYSFTNKDGHTMLNAKEELYYAMTDEQFDEANKGWDYALLAVKEIAEAL